MNNKMKILFKYLILFLVGAVTYYLIEILYRGYSFYSMAITGGICFLLIGGINEFYYTWEMSLLKQSVIGSVIITIIEFIAGCILNLWLGLGIWDYSNEPCNLLGQICLSFTLAWVLLSGVAVIVDDWLRYWLFDEEKPHYTFK